MPTFQEVVETIRPDDKGHFTAISKEDGMPISALRRQTPTYKKNLAEAASLVERVLAGSRRAMFDFEEAMGSSDFPLYLGDVIDRALVANYTEAPNNLRSICRDGTARDFRDAHLFTQNGAEARWDKVAPGTPYPERATAEGRYTIKVDKYGAQIPLYWELVVNDDLGMFRDLPQRLTRGAIRTEKHLITELHTDAGGPRGDIYSGDNLLSVPLNLDGLEAAMNVLSSQVDADGEPIDIEGIILEVPTKLGIHARRVLAPSQIITGDITSGDQIALTNTSWADDLNLTLIVNKYLDKIDASGKEDATWYLHADPAVGREAFAFRTLAGFPAPQILMKRPDTQYVGGGDVPPEFGDFETDSLFYKGRHVIGGAPIDGKGTVASTGS